MAMRVKGLVEAGLAGALCALMVVPPGMVAEMPVETRVAPLTQQERVLQALNRMTFGPRPGEVAAVSREGVERWFERQLHPETIDDAALEARLAMFPAMRLSQAELLAKFPPPQRIKAMERQGAALPSDPVERAIYADSEAAYAEKVKNAGQVANAQAAAGGPPEMSMDDAAAAGAAALAETGQPVGGMQRFASGAPAASGPVAIGRGADAAVPTSGVLMSDGTYASPTHDDSAVVKGKGKRKAAPMESGSVEAVLALPPEQRMQRLVAMSPEEMLAFRSGLKPRERLELVQGLSPAQVEVVAAMQGPARVVGAEALESRLVRDIYSQRQVQAVMTDFWLNHFSVYVRKNQNEPYLLPAYERDVVLPNALGNFEQLLVATAESPAMLEYLDNWQSIGPNSVAATRMRRVQQVNPQGKIAQALPKGINENYARELMELHTLGVGGGYTQQDVIEVAKCFTGWTIDRPYQGGGMQFVFEPNRHEPGSKTVLGHVIPEGGMNEGLAVLHILATSPATAKFISNKLAVRFVSDTPPPALVDRMAATFTRTNGDIKAVLLTMFRSPEFWSPQVYRAKVKTPVEFLVSALRASDADVKTALPLVQAMERLGMPVYGMQTPNGYSWKADEWVSSNALIARMNFALVLSADRLPGTQTSWVSLLGNGEATPATEKKLEALLLGQPAAVRTRETVLAQFNDATVQGKAEEAFNARPVMDDGAEMAGGGLMRVKAGRGGRGGFGQDAGPASPLDTMAGLLLGSPDFQRR
jgi:uncharacterized protein (DUF1800 family)